MNKTIQIGKRVYEIHKMEKVTTTNLSGFYRFGVRWTYIVSRGRTFYTVNEFESGAFSKPLAAPDFLAKESV